ncbi:CU044_5270 family protein [Actinophytocola xanthii]|uniref:Uncharacterized protein n=1 Tax=Actinophytocola xanthii TaxID=1912961 RepID=A0A1Q8CNL7_9PSEU|nr:CU044_5270 family protein [Actinophytocola xanthii]OLF15959.1 hypothetical protein BU204_18810 [Actinophytocola xanthii]
MDELALLKDMGEKTPLPPAADLAPARARLAAVFPVAAAETAVPRRRRRLLIPSLTATGLAAAITAVVAFGGLEPFGVAPPQAEAVAFLHEAADAARVLPATPPRPEQFVYTRTRQGDGSVRESWFSADGTHDGLIRQDGLRIPMPGCRDGRRAVMRGEVDTTRTEPCTPEPADRSDLPTDAAGMREYLSRAELEPERGEIDFDVLVHFGLTEKYLPPRALAALFEVMADFPGLTIDENATDGAGRPGIGLTWAQPADQNEVMLVFDRESHALLGIAGESAVVEQAVVDAVDQRP